MDLSQVVTDATAVSALLVPKYAQLISIAAGIGTELVSVIKGYAQANLSAADYAALEVAWQGDVAESATNAGIPIEPDVPLA